MGEPLLPLKIISELLPLFPLHNKYDVDNYIHIRAALLPATCFGLLILLMLAIAYLARTLIRYTEKSPHLMDFWGLLNTINYIKLTSAVQVDVTAI